MPSALERGVTLETLPESDTSSLSNSQEIVEDFSQRLNSYLSCTLEQLEREEQGIGHRGEKLDPQEASKRRDLTLISLAGGIRSIPGSNLHLDGEGEARPAKRFIFNPDPELMARARAITTPENIQAAKERLGFQD